MNPRRPWRRWTHEIFPRKRSGDPAYWTHDSISKLTGTKDSTIRPPRWWRRHRPGPIREAKVHPASRRGTYLWSKARTRAEATLLVCAVGEGGGPACHSTVKMRPKMGQTGVTVEPGQSRRIGRNRGKISGRRSRIRTCDISLVRASASPYDIGTYEAVATSRCHRAPQKVADRALRSSRQPGRQSSQSRPPGPSARGWPPKAPELCGMITRLRLSEISMVAPPIQSSGSTP